MEVIAEYGKLNEAALLFSLSVFFSPHQSDIRSRLGHSKKQRKKKKEAISNSHTLILLPLFLLLSLPLSSLPHPLWKTQGISRQSLVCWSGRLLNHAPAQAPGQLSPLGGAHLRGSRALAEKKRLYIVIFSCRTKGVSGGEHLRRPGQRKTERDESWALQLSEETKQYTREIITAGKHTPTTGNKKVNIAWVLSVFPSLFFGVCAGMAVCGFRSMYECVCQGSCERLERLGRFVTGASGCRQKHLARLLWFSEARNILYTACWELYQV